MKQKVKKKSNPFLIFTSLLLIAIIGSFVIKLLYFTAKETVVVLDTQKTTIRTTEEKEIAPNASSTEKSFDYRKNWKEYISIAPLHKDVQFTVTPEGKINNLYIPIINKTEYLLESITIKIHFINPSNRNSISTQILEIKQIAPNNKISFKGPDNQIGLSVLCEIIKVRSKQMSFCYDEEILKDAQGSSGISGNPNDPWHCQ